MARLNPISCSILTSGMSSIVHGFFTRQGGVSSGIYESLNVGTSSNDKSQNIRANRRAIVAHMGLDDQDLITPWQQHSFNVEIATSNWAHKRPKADGVVTATRNLPIAIITADCGPVLFCDAKKQNHRRSSCRLARSNPWCIRQNY